MPRVLRYVHVVLRGPIGVAALVVCMSVPMVLLHLAMRPVRARGEVDRGVRAVTESYLDILSRAEVISEPLALAVLRQRWLTLGVDPKSKDLATTSVVDDMDRARGRSGAAIVQRARLLLIQESGRWSLEEQATLVGSAMGLPGIPDSLVGGRRPATVDSIALATIQQIRSSVRGRGIAGARLREARGLLEAIGTRLPDSVRVMHDDLWREINRRLAVVDGIGLPVGKGEPGLRDARQAYARRLSALLDQAGLQLRAVTAGERSDTLVFVSLGSGGSASVPRAVGHPEMIEVLRDLEFRAVRSGEGKTIPLFREDL